MIFFDVNLRRVLDQSVIHCSCHLKASVLWKVSCLRVIEVEVVFLFVIRSTIPRGMHTFVMQSCIYYLHNTTVLAGSPSRGGDVAVYVFDINQPSLPTPFSYSVLVSISVFMSLSTVFHSIKSPDISPFSHPVLPVLPLPYWSFQLYVSM